MGIYKKEEGAVSSRTRMFDRLRRQGELLISSKTMTTMLQKPGTLMVALLMGSVGFVAWDLGPPGTFANILLFSRIYPSPKKDVRRLY